VLLPHSLLSHQAESQRLETAASLKHPHAAKHNRSELATQQRNYEKETLLCTAGDTDDVFQRGGHTQVAQPDANAGRRQGRAAHLNFLLQVCKQDIHGYVLCIAIFLE